MIKMVQKYNGWTILQKITKKCGKEFGINTFAKSLLPLDEELKELHNYLANYR